MLMRKTLPYPSRPLMRDISGLRYREVESGPHNWGGDILWNDLRPTELSGAARHGAVNDANTYCVVARHVRNVRNLFPQFDADATGTSLRARFTF
jgi:hypothetical protein